MGPKSHEHVLVRVREGGDRHGEGDKKTVTMGRASDLQAEEHRGRPAITRSWQRRVARFSLRASGRHQPCPHPDLEPLTHFCCFKPPVVTTSHGPKKRALCCWLPCSPLLPSPVFCSGHMGLFVLLEQPRHPPERVLRSGASQRLLSLSGLGLASPGPSLTLCADDCLLPVGRVISEYEFTVAHPSPLLSFPLPYHSS